MKLLKRLTRREVISTLAGGAIATGLFEAVSALPVYGKKLAPLAGKESVPRKRMLVVYSHPSAIEEPLRKMSWRAPIAVALPGAAVGWLHAKKRQDRRGSKLAVPAFALGAAAGAWAAGRHYGAIKSEAREFNLLVRDLQNAGYEVRRTAGLQEFQNLLASAGKNRPEDGRTIVLVDAHGGVSQRFGSFISGEENLVMPVEQLAKTVGRIPGHTLVVSASCNFDAKHFQKSVGKGVLSVLALSGGSPRRKSAWELPLYSALRIGLRNPNAVLSSTREALEKQLGKTPWVTRFVLLQLFKAGRPAVQAQHEFSL